MNDRQGCGAALYREEALAPLPCVESGDIPHLACIDMAQRYAVGHAEAQRSLACLLQQYPVHVHADGRQMREER